MRGPLRRAGRELLRPLRHVLTRTMPCLPSGSGSLRKRSMERKFTRVLARPGMAAQLRENVSQAVKETTIQVRARMGVPFRGGSGSLT